MRDIQSTSIPVITVDGPSSSGKGTLSVLLARRLKFNVLDSGVIYRALAYVADQAQVAFEALPKLVDLAQKLDLVFQLHETDNRISVILNHQDITQALRAESCGMLASRLAVLPKIREALLAKQRQFAQLPGLVADGRDMGTVVFPDAQVKFYLDASLRVRAQRRYQELKNTQPDVTLQSTLEELNVRDQRDKKRAVAPLKTAVDAIVLDTSHLSMEAVFEVAMQFIQQRLSIV